MKNILITILFVGLFLVSTDSRAQDATSSAVQNAEKLKAQLQEVQDKEAALKARAQQLDEDLKPENIERSLAGVGSTRPEELRELRRRQLSIEKASVLKQLEQLQTSRTRLESAIVEADAVVYQQSAQGTPFNHFGLNPQLFGPRWVIGMVGGFLLIMGLGLLAFRKLQRTVK
jgi:hypothetical protein